MDLEVLQAFVKYAGVDPETPPDYLATRAAVTRMFPKLAAPIGVLKTMAGGAALGGGINAYRYSRRAPPGQRLDAAIAGGKSGLGWGAGLAGAGTLMRKLSWDWKKFREGAEDEGVPLGGATVGAGLGAALSKNPGSGGLRGAALGYAVGSGASLLRSKLKGEEPSNSRRLLALSGLGYGLGGLAHGGLTKLVKPGAGAGRALLHGGTSRLHKGLEAVGAEGLPVIGATIGAGSHLATEKKKKRQQAA